MILVTGGTGYLGSNLVKRLFEKYSDIKIRTISPSEFDIQKLKWYINDSRLETLLGDIRDTNTVEFALKDADTVLHLAAMKHIEICEDNPIDAVTTNVYGTINLLKYFTGKTFISMSTDKALEPIGCYGATKLLQEKLISSQAKSAKNKRFIIVRSGNIFASRGSVLDRWREQLKKNNEIIVTDLTMTRYFIDVDTLADFIINIMKNGKNGYVYIPNQVCVTLADLVKAFIEVWGNKNTKIKELGLRKGERSHELLYLASEKNVVTDMDNISSQNAAKLSMKEIKQYLLKAKERM
jgi:UDP-N-acetylglucosamine 4,6-dehydratase